MTFILHTKKYKINDQTIKNCKEYINNIVLNFEQKIYVEDEFKKEKYEKKYFDYYYEALLRLKKHGYDWDIHDNDEPNKTD